MKTWKRWTFVAVVAIFGIVVGFTACDPSGSGGDDPVDPTKIGDFKFGTQTIALHATSGANLTADQITALKTELPKVNPADVPRFSEITKIEITGISTTGSINPTSPAPGVIRGDILPEITAGNLWEFLFSGTQEFAMMYDREESLISLK
jgi:hypothetical protein